MQSLPFDMIELNRSFKTKEEAIRYCGQKLVEAGCVDEEYIDAMVERDILSRFLMEQMKQKNM